jgi:serine/threonine protein kinase
MMEKKKSGEVPALLLLEPIYIMLQIAVAVNYLHESWVMHCDLKVSNVLLNIVEDQNGYFSLSSVQDKLHHCCLSKLKLHSLGYNHTIGGYKPGGGHLRYLKMRRTETRTQNYQVCIALQLFSLRYSMGKSQQMLFRAFVTD